MIKDIKYNGYTAQPSDYECPDGQLAASLNLISEDSQLKPIQQPVPTSIGLSATQEVMFVHETSAFVHYIIYGNDSKVSYVVKGGNSDPVVLDQNNQYIYGVTHFNAVGNTLLAFTKSGINYFLWKSDKYVYLGDHVPEVDISFGLIGRPRIFSQCDESKKSFDITFEPIGAYALGNEFSENNKTKITEQVMAKVNKFVREQTVDKGRFCFPFFVRYALRLFDGSLVNHSAPILMNPSTTTCPVVFWKYISGKESYTNANLDIMLVAASLDYKIMDSGDAYILKTWSDIVTGIDIFISKPIYTFDQNGKCSSWVDTDNFTTKFIGRLYATNKDTTYSYPSISEDKIIGSFTSRDFLDIYAEWSYARIFSIYFTVNREYPAKTLHLPEFTEGKIAETIRNTSTFYKLCSIDTNEAYAKRGTRTEIVVEDDYLQSLVTREVMTDDYLSHDVLSADSSYAFNSRLNLAGVWRKPFRGFLGASMFAYCNNHYNWEHENGSDTTLKITPLPLAAGVADMSVTVYINENGREYSVQASDFYADHLVRYLSLVNQNNVKFKRSWGCYVFYPNVNAHKMLISNPSYGGYLITLKPHEFLNGAYALLDYETVREVNYTGADLPTVSNDPASSGRSNYIPQPNKVFTSEVNNPFFFPLQGINSVGTGKILGICSAAKALSQGQFGQFPLYAFTDEGVWAMELSSTGLYNARQPITRDVMLKGTQPLQMDSAVLFATDRGIMLISGSQTQCITDVINSKEPFDVLQLPGMAKLHSMLGHNADTCLPTAPFLEFIAECGMLYDYVHQRVIVYNPHYTYAYVYSLKSKEWGMMYSTIEAGINSYPEALAVDHDGALLNFSAMEGEATKGLFVTRPLKLETPDVLKTMDTVIQRGHFQKGHVQSVLYGSRDLFNWHLVWSSKDHYLRGFRGTPYKYFRIACVTSLADDESIFGASLQFNPRQTNQPR